VPDGIPDRVSIREVGPRDGFQNEPEVIATDDKVRLVEMLAGTGLKRLEVTSFVRADVIPQLADGTEVLTRAEIPDDVSVSVLIPNERGLDNALQLRERIDEINVFLSASETHNGKNVNRSIEESLEGLERVLPRAREAGLRCEGVISVSFGCPYEGEVKPQAVVDVARALWDLGCYEISLGDTIGVGTPLKARQLLRAVVGHVPMANLAMHFHDTYGQALANLYAGMEEGCRVIDSAAGGLGGCPYAPGATGNVATEDVVYMLEGMGFATGVDMPKLVAATNVVSRLIGRPPVSRVAPRPGG